MFKSTTLRGVLITAASAIALVAPATASAGAATVSPPAPTTSANIAAGYLAQSFFYTDAQNANQSLTATYKAGRTNAPWVVTIHGGGWNSGVQAEVQPAVEVFTKAGFQVFNISYRFVPPGADQVTWADQKQDVLTAISWIRRYASAFGIDPNRGALWGFSAGAHLATIAGLSGDGDNGIRVVVSNSGPVGPARLWQEANGQVNDGPNPSSLGAVGSLEETATGCRYDSTDATCVQSWKNFEPASYISPHDPAVLLYQGTADPLISTTPTQLFGNRLAAANLVTGTALVPNVGHSLVASLDGGTRQNAMVNFIVQRTSVNIAPSTSTTALAVSPTSPTAGKASSFLVGVDTANGATGGWMTLSSDSFNQSVVMNGSYAKFSVPGMTRGVHRFTAYYGGSTVAQTATATLDVVVK